MFSFSNVPEKLVETCEALINEKYLSAYNSKRGSELQNLSDFELIAIAYISSWKLIVDKLDNPSNLDKRTSFSREKVGGYLFDTEFIKNDPKFHLFILLRFAWEFRFSVESYNTFDFSNYVEPKLFEKLDEIDPAVWNSASSFPDCEFCWIKDVMPYEIYRDLLSSPEMTKAKSLINDVEDKKNELKDEIDKILEQASSSIDYLDSVRQEANDLGERLTNIKREGNFKLLAKAFSTLRKSKAREVMFAQFRMWMFIFLLIILPCGLFGYFTAKDVVLNLVSWLKFLPLISIEFLSFYFMRLFYMEVKSLKSQLVQIDLRLNLCEFIYDYVETRDRVHTQNNSHSWKAFETLIFSPIQPNEDKIPSVMDGTDALATLVGKIMSAKTT